MSYLKSAPWNLYICKILRKNKKCLNLEPKMPYWVFLTKNAQFGCFGAKILKKLLSYLQSAPSNLSNCKISWKNKNAQISDQECLIWVFLTKNALFGYSRARILRNYCHIWNQHPKMCQIAKFCEKKCLNLGAKMPYVAVFGLEF